MPSARAAALPKLAPTVLQPSQRPGENPFALPLNTVVDAPKVRARKGRVKRFFGFLVLLAIVGGAVYAGVVHGPELMTLAKGESQTGGPSAPLTFPKATRQAPTVRTATFIVENPVDSDLPLSYEVTTDFETGIAQIIVDRADQPQLEILTVFDGAVIRRTDENVWYQLERGDFPIDRDLGRERWVRSLDELFPRSVRKFATIDAASEETLGDESMKRLVISIDPDRLIAEELAAPDAVAVVTDQATAPNEAAAPAEPDAATDDAIAAEVPDPVGTPASPPSLPPGITLDETVVSNEQLTIETWVDKSGTIRRLILPQELGGETVTVVSTSPEAWQPQFPGLDRIEPLTASALFGLGL